MQGFFYVALCFGSRQLMAPCLSVSPAVCLRLRKRKSAVWTWVADNLMLPYASQRYHNACLNRGLGSVVSGQRPVSFVL